VIAALAGILIWALLRDAGAGPPLTLAVTTTGTTATTPTTAPDTTTTVDAAPPTTTAEQRLAEVEEILRELWFGWFDAIYRKDEDALWEVVATTRNYEAGLAAMETMEFVAEPNPSGVIIVSADILLDRADCLVVYQRIDVSSFRGAGSITETVTVLWPDPRYNWRRATSWKYRNDLWLQDCDNLEREQTP
jgi:hypothetical protein